MAFFEVSLNPGAPLDIVALELFEHLAPKRPDLLTLIISSSIKMAKEFLIKLESIEIKPDSVYISSCSLTDLDVATIAILLDIDTPLSETYRLTQDGTKLLPIKPWSLSNIISQLSAPEPQLRKLDLDWFLQSTKHLKLSIDDYHASNISTFMREGMIALNSVLRFEDLRTTIGSCTLPVAVQSADHTISSTIKEAIRYAKNLQSAKSIAYIELKSALEHLADGSLAADMYNNSASDLIFYRKVQVWQSSLHLSLATSLSKREGSSNLSLHHCTRCIECYLTGILSTSKKIFITNKGVAFYASNSKPVQGVSGLLDLSPETVPTAIRNIVSWRNKSELAHGMQRWNASTAAQALLEVRNFIYSMDAKHSQGEFFIHLQKANSLRISEATSSIMDIIKKKIDAYLVKEI